MKMARGHPQRHDLLDYVEGSLNPADRAEVKQHLDTCAACTELVADATAGKRMLSASPPLELSPGRTESIMAALDEPAPKRERSRPSWRLVAVVAAALALAVPLSYVALSGGNDDADSSGVAAEADNQEDAGGADTGAAAPQEPELTILRGTKGKPAKIVAALEAGGLHRGGRRQHASSSRSRTRSSTTWSRCSTRSAPARPSSSRARPR